MNETAQVCPRPIVVIRSTAPPGSTALLQSACPKLTLCFMPEFLSEDTAEQDFLRPSRLVIGFAEFTQRHRAQEVFDLLPSEHDCPLLIMHSTEAELAKYFANAFYATKVAFANQMFDMADVLGANYERIRQAAEADPMCGPSHLDVHHKGYRGYGGKCLPKDVQALLAAAETAGTPLTTLQAASYYNSALLRSQGR